MQCSRQAKKAKKKLSKQNKLKEKEGALVDDLTSLVNSVRAKAPAAWDLRACPKYDLLLD